MAEVVRFARTVQFRALPRTANRPHGRKRGFQECRTSNAEGEDSRQKSSFFIRDIVIRKLCVLM